MTSSGPYTPYLNFTHMFNIPDLRGPLPIKLSSPNTLLNIIQLHPDFQKFYHLIKLANLENILNDIQADFTMFVSSDKALSRIIGDDIFTNMDILTARAILRSSMLNNRISSEVFKDSPCAYYNTVDQANRLCITNVNGETYINNTAKVNNINKNLGKNAKVIYKDIVATNGIIHVIDNLIIPYIV